MAASGSQTLQLRAHTNKGQLVKERAAAMGEEVQQTTEFFDEAARRVYARALRGVSPPWLRRAERSPPHLLPAARGSGVPTGAWQ